MRERHRRGRRRLAQLGLGEPDDPTAPGERTWPAVLPLLELARDDQRRRLGGTLDTARGNREDLMG